MSRIHPSHNHHQGQDQSMSKEKTHPYVLTVWKRSTMTFQGTDGFTVFDHHGKLAFRVDNYSRNNSTAILMDGAGKALLTLKPQIFSMQWHAYRGEGCCRRRKSSERGEKPKALFSMRSSGSMVFNGGSGDDEEAQVFMGPTSSSSSSGCKAHDDTPDFKVQGCFRRRNCVIRNSQGEIAARISRKRVKNKTVVLGDDVFNLVVQPGFQPQLMMAFIIVLDRIHNKHYYTPLLCS
ncbi:protein LURP-one-related 5-like [Prosopis cineraria]|uniref:protein LURP-one-related 5-like n=1 Tax=Prosopis cineraria TaxID=364024 RepID=UPI00240EE6A2|nr:protein LURP-one-related 5-like [Prosopis cineraria]